jgi:hypothetical protein
MPAGYVGLASGLDSLLLGTHWLGGWAGPRVGLDVVDMRETSAPVTN